MYEAEWEKEEIDILDSISSGVEQILNNEPYKKRMQLKKILEDKNKE